MNLRLVCLILVWTNVSTRALFNKVSNSFLYVYDIDYIHWYSSIVGKSLVVACNHWGQHFQLYYILIFRGNNIGLRVCNVVQTKAYLKWLQCEYILFTGLMEVYFISVKTMFGPVLYFQDILNWWRVSVCALLRQLWLHIKFVRQNILERL